MFIVAGIDAAGHVEGVTRLQKSAFLAANGPFSRELANDVTQVVNDNLVKKEIKPNLYGYKVAMLIHLYLLCSKCQFFP